MKKFFFLLFFIFTITSNTYAAGSSSGSSSSTKIISNYDKAVKLIKAAKKYEKKEKAGKANKRYKKAFKLLVISNNKKPNNADTLNYLGFTARKLGYYEKGENYYLEGLALKPNHKGINEYLGELYVVTNRIDLAKERLKILKSCNCKEYQELKDIIDGTKKSKY